MENKLDTSEADTRAIVRELFAKNQSRFPKEGEPPVRSNRFIGMHILEEGLMQARKEKDVEKEKIFEKELKDEYSIRFGHNIEEVENYLKALIDGNPEERKKIELKKAASSEEVKRFEWAAEEYYEAREYKKSAEAWVKAAHNLGSSYLFIFAAKCLMEGGVKKEEAYGMMAEELRKFIKQREEKEGWWYHRDEAYTNFGEVLHQAGDREAALEAFGKIGGGDYHGLESAIHYLVRIEDWKRAVQYQKKLISSGNAHREFDNLRLAEYCKRAGLKRDEAEALWKAGRYLDGARIAYEITNDRGMFYRAAKGYLHQRSSRDFDFFDGVWKHVEHVLMSEEKNDEDRLNMVHKVFVVLHSAYSLPAPPEPDKSILSLNREEHGKLVQEKYNEFAKKLKVTKSAAVPALLSEFGLVISMEHAILYGLETMKVKDILRSAFGKITRKRPLEVSIHPELREIWQKAIESEKSIIGYDPVEMAGRSFEEGEYYKEAKERYLKASLLTDTARMDKLIKEGKSQTPPKV